MRGDEYLSVGGVRHGTEQQERKEWPEDLRPGAERRSEEAADQRHEGARLQRVRGVSGGVGLHGGPIVAEGYQVGQRQELDWTLSALHATLTLYVLTARRLRGDMTTNGKTAIKDESS